MSQDAYTAHFVNKNVRVWPDDAGYKDGTIIAAMPEGIIVKITKSSRSSWPVGSTMFLSWEKLHLRFED